MEHVTTKQRQNKLVLFSVRKGWLRGNLMLSTSIWSKDAKKMEAVSPEVCSGRKGSSGDNLQQENSGQILGKEIALWTWQRSDTLPWEVTESLALEVFKAKWGMTLSSLIYPELDLPGKISLNRSRSYFIAQSQPNCWQKVAKPGTSSVHGRESSLGTNVKWTLMHRLILLFLLCVITAWLDNAVTWIRYILNNTNGI